MDLTVSPRRRRLLFAALYLAEGAPIGFVWWALPTLLREAGHELARITTLLALLSLPWTLKLLGGPLVDLARGAGWPLKRLLAGAQLAMTATLLPLTRPGALQDLDLLTVCLLLHAVSAALQDVVVDALCLSVTPEHERGRVNGWMQAGMLVGRGAFGGGALLLAAQWGQTAAPAVLVGLVGAALLVVLFGVPAAAGAAPVARPLHELARALGAVARRRATWRALAFALVAAGGFEAVGAVAGAYLVDRGLTSAEIALRFELPKVVAMALGALLGGRLCDRWGAAAATARFQVAFSGCILALAALDSAGQGGSWIGLVALGALYFAIGLFTSASYTLLMNLTAPRLAATQFSAFMGATNGCEMWAAFAIGRLQPSLGYAGAFGLMALVSLVAVPLVPRAGGGDRERPA
ncbi:MAG TPA: MFS transporter [Planctomycetota bacterium]|nr:MFS transporter [Planctomycetota bacterium]